MRGPRRPAILRAVSQQNVDTVLQAVEAVNRGEPESVRHLFDEDVLWEPARSGIEGSYHGVQGMREWWADTRENFESFELKLEDVRDAGSGVLTIGTIHVRGTGSGAEAEVPIAAIWTFKDGRLVHFKDYGDRRVALKTAGLED